MTETVSMTGLLELILTIVILTSLVMLGTGRVRFGIRMIALQGIAIGFVPLLVTEHGFGMRPTLLAALGLGLKGIVFPRLLMRARRDAEVKNEPAPWVGYSLSVVLGILMLAFSLWLGQRLPEHGHALVVPVALFTILSGLFLIVGRNLAISQVVGYLVMENGIFLAGLALAQEEPLLVEMGILVDVFGAVLVMGVAIFHIRRTFDTIEVGQLTKLKD
jgi:hydrogenase-4 component E